MVLSLDFTFRHRGAIRVECPILFPRTINCCSSAPLFEMTSVATVPNEVPKNPALRMFHPTRSPALHPDQFHRHRVFLDRHGAPVFFPNRLVPGFARTAPAFLASGPSICRRFAIQNVQYSSEVPLNSETGRIQFPSEVTEHMHAFYDIGAELARILEPDIMNGILRTAATATRCIRSKKNFLDRANLLIFLMRLPTTSPLSRCLRRSVESAFRRLYCSHAVALLEAEAISVACQSIGSVRLIGQKCV